MCPSAPSHLVLAYWQFRKNIWHFIKTFPIDKYYCMIFKEGILMRVFFFIRNDRIAHYVIFSLTNVMVLTNLESPSKFIFSTWHLSLLVDQMSPGGQLSPGSIYVYFDWFEYCGWLWSICTLKSIFKIFCY